MALCSYNILYVSRFNLPVQHDIGDAHVSIVVSRDDIAAFGAGAEGVTIETLKVEKYLIS